MFADKIKSIYKGCNGIEIYSDYTADLGFTALEGNHIKISVEGSSYKDFTIGDDSFSGTELEYNEGYSGWTAACITAHSAQDDPIGIDASIPSEYAESNTRVAVYLIEGGSGENTYIHFGIRCYDYLNETFSYQTPFYLYDMSRNNTDNFYLIGLPGANPPGNVSWKWSRFDEMLHDCNTIRGAAPNDFVGEYYNITHITTNIPIFDSQAHAETYLLDPTETTGLLNAVAEVDPEEEYNEQFDFFYIRNKYGHNTRNVLTPNQNERNYRFYPYDATKRGGGKLALLWHQPTAAEPYTFVLKNWRHYDCFIGQNIDSESEDEFINTNDVIENYLDRSISFGASDYWTAFICKTNIPFFKNQETFEDYENDLVGIEAADNYQNLCRIDNSIMEADWAGTTRDTETETSYNGQSYGFGCRLYAISHTELSSLFIELFNPANVQTILDGCKLFGADGIMQGISGIMYIPITDLSDICGLGQLTHIQLGSWTAQNAEGRRITDNQGVINCGSFVMSETYGDFRDYEPYTELFIQLPMGAGFHQLDLSKYLGKEVTVKAALDITTAAICFMIFSNGILLDQFQGTCGASRPFSATDNNAYINNIVNAITGAGGVGSAVKGAQDIAGAATKLASSSGGVAALSAAGAAVGGTAVVAAGAASGIFSAYQIKNAVDNPPQIISGNLAGNLSYFSNKKVHFIIARKRTIRPENELALVGYPSGHGGVVGQFSGFLECSAFKLADGFTGTEAERSEIIEVMKGGIYI